MKYSLAQLQQLAANAGFPDPALAAAVAMAESCGNTCAQGDPNIGGTPCNVDDPAHSCAGPNGTSRSFGPWQVFTVAHPEYDHALLLNPVYNAQAALAISKTAKGWGHWSTYNDGSYLPFYVPFAPAPLPIQPENITPPTTSTGAPVIVVAASALALAAAAGYAARETRRRRFA